MADNSFNRVLVLGSKKCGKTSILSAALNGEFADLYAPTAHLEEYFDVGRKLRLIDTPGLSTDVLLADRKWSTFEQDAVVRELTSVVSTADRKLIGDLNITQVRAFVIVYSSVPHYPYSFEAQGLRQMVRRFSPSVPIYLVNNRGDIQPHAHDEQLHERRKALGKDASAFDGHELSLPPDEHTVELKVCAATYFRLAELLDRIKADVQAADDEEQKNSKSMLGRGQGGADGRACNTKECALM